MLEIAASIFAFALFLFLTFIFWQLAADSDNMILLALFGSLIIVFAICAFVSFVVFFCAFLTIGGAENG